MSGLRRRFSICDIVHALIDKSKDQNRNAKRTECRNPLIFVPAATHKNCKTGRREHKQYHPEVEILVHKETRRDDGKSND